MSAIGLILEGQAGDDLERVREGMSDLPAVHAGSPTRCWMHRAHRTRPKHDA
jgi:hypothetical protein